MKAAKGEQIVRQILAGKVNAFVEMKHRYQQEVRQAVEAVVSDSNAVEEIVEEVFLKAYLKLDQWPGKGDFGEWLAGIARQLASDLKEFGLDSFPDTMADHGGSHDRIH